MRCLAKHAKYQILEDAWKCPKCGVGHEYIDDKGHKVEGLIIEEPDESAHDGCALLHEKDGIRCAVCDKWWTGKELSKIMAKRANMMTCPTCHGKGMVKRP